jgi:hypothetical protein
MKLTLDHNVIVDFANRSPNVEHLRELIADGSYQAFVVEIGASEMRQRGIQPDRYDLFEQLLFEAGLASLPRLSPMVISDVTFWDHALWSDKAMASQADKIEEILFGGSPPFVLAGAPEDSRWVAARLNRICDVQTMWCHLYYGNEVFVTSDRNFHKVTKLPRLLELGAGRVSKPEEL